jgi:tryptophan 2,3-dioxygenase
MGSQPKHHAPAGSTPYSAYVQTDKLHSLQALVSDSPAEMAFLVNVQIMELYWALTVHELQAAQANLRQDNVAEANRTLTRTIAHMKASNATWGSLSWMTPSDLMPILMGLAATHGRDTALQGWTYRHMVYLLGIKERQHLVHFEPQPSRFAQLEDALEAPSLYDDVLGALRRSGAQIPEDAVSRDYSVPYVPLPEVEGAWLDIYSRNDPSDPWLTLAEKLTDVAVEFTNWKYLHLLATRRTFGRRPAYHGVDAVEWLTPTMDEIPFPELWNARSGITPG